MPTLTLTPRERAAWERLARHTDDADQLRRVDALLALADGMAASAVARTRRVGRSTLYEWLARFEEHRRGDLHAATTTRTAPGRSRELRDRVVARVGELMDKAPGDFGYRHTNWTTGLLLDRLEKEEIEASDSTVRRALHESGYRWKRPRFVLSRRSPTWRQAQGGSAGGLKGRERTAVLFTDATILTETPPPRACWAKVGERAEVPITGNRAKRVVFGALNVGTGTVCLDEAAGWNQHTFRDHLRPLRSLWRGWNLVLFLDRGSPHTARASRALARELGIELRLLPTACPELNPLEGLWREIKGRVLSNEPTPDLDVSLRRALDHREGMTGRQRLQAAGVLSDSFWLPT